MGGDGVLRWLWPTVLILAADYEEAYVPRYLTLCNILLTRVHFRCVMALIRGLQGLYPCPICYVPWQEQSDLSTEHPLRTREESELVLQEARSKRTAAEQDDHLQDHGLRDVEVCTLSESSTRLNSMIIE